MTARLSLLAVALCATAVAQPPKPALSPEEEKGRELFRNQKFEEAVEEFRKAGKANPALPPPRVMLSELLYQAKEGQAARQSLERAAAEDPDHPAVLLLNASFALGEGRVTDTVLSCQAALRAAESPRWDAAQRTKFQREARLGLAAGLEARRDFNSAREQLAALTAADPKNAVVRARLGAALFLTGKPDDAFTEFTTAFKDDATIDPPELQMARLWVSRPDAAKAEEWFKKAIGGHPKSGKVVREYAGWLMGDGKLAEAKPHLDAAAGLDPAARDTSALKGLYARYTRDLPTAERMFDDLYRLSPRDRFAGLNLALVLAESGDAVKQKRSVELAESLVQQAQKSADGYAVLGWCYFHSGRVEDAERALLTAASAGAVERDTAYYLGKVFLSKGKGDDARKVLNNALSATGPFVNKTAAEALLAEVNQKFPPKPEEKK